MKILKKHYDHAFYIHFPIGIISTALILFFQPQIIITFKAHWVLLLLALILILPPFGGVRLGAENQAPRFKWPLWLAALFGLEIGVYVLFYNVSAVSNYSLPVLISTAFSFTDSLRLTHLSWGLFPWGIYVLLAVAIGFTAFRQNRTTTLSIILQPLFKNTTEDVIGITADFYARALILISINYSLAFVCLTFASFIAHMFGLQIISGLQISTMILATCMLVLIQHPEAKKWLYKIVTFNLALPLLILGFIFALTILILLVSLFFSYALIHVPELKQNIDFFSTQNWPKVWIIFMGIWWVSWTPLIASVMAIISEGYKIRTVIFAALILPFLISIFLVFSHQHWKLMAIDPSWINLLSAVIALIILFSLFLRQKFLAGLMRAVLTKASSSAKRRSPIFFIRNLLQLFILLTVLYLVGGIHLLVIIAFIISLPGAMVMIYSGIALYISLLKKIPSPTSEGRD